MENCDICNRQTNERELIYHEGVYICQSCFHNYDDEELKEIIEEKGIK